MADDLILTGDISGYYYGDPNTSTQGTCTVVTATNATVVAPNSVTFNPGFRVELGGTLKARIGDDYGEDSDTLPDSWEWDNFGTFDQGPDDDPDSDGLTNIEEYNHGTNPNNPHS